ncbi:restriction endonuclease subunit S [Acidovorax temperans]|uniref:restriction endonuclease subunit S n=1 Tax=Acidovorax temperans TaxID=80878 RepID=UPI002359F46D|nr:restriction endonuclease subunit S [Acidovorax temperans]WCT24455.1 restriction endonuclease subunit S [Acidovorax temperans]
MSAVTAKWALTRLGDICEFKYGKSLPETARAGGDISVFGSNGIVGAHNSALTEGPTIVIGRKGSHGEVNFSPASCWPIDTTYYVDHSATKADIRWLFHRLCGAGLNQMNRAAAVPGLNREDAYRVEILLPPLEEQRRIAAILDQAETLRTQRRTALALLDSLTQSLFLDMFGDPATNPRKWPVKRLKDLGQVITGGTPPSSKEGMFDGPIPFITPGDLESEEPVRRSVTEAGAKEVNVVRAGATLVCCIGATIGKVGIAQKDSAFNQQLNAVVWGNHISDNYGYEVMRFFKPTIISWGASTTLPILKKSSFEQIEIPVPPVPLQELFTDRLKHISNLKGLHKSALLGFDNLFNALQSRAFAGEP